MPHNRSAKEGLFYVLRQQNRSAEANSLLASLPDSVRQSVAPRGNSSDPLRAQAKRELAAGNRSAAIATLNSAIQRYPSDGWLRLDLARIYRAQGDSLLAANVMQPTLRSGASTSELYAGALNASESGAWQQASQLLARIPNGSKNSEMRELAQRVNFNLQMATADRYLAQGSDAAAANTLRALAATPPANPVDAGNLAQMLAQSRRSDHGGYAGARQYAAGRAGQCRGLRRADCGAESGGAEPGSTELPQQSGAAGAQYPHAAGRHP